MLLPRPHYNVGAKEEWIMFQENLKALRKQKGMTQEELAARLNVVRQTVSKWEKGLSVPDAAILMNIAEVFDVPVSRLLGGEIDDDARPDVAEQLARINEQLAVKNRRAKRVWKTVAIVLGSFAVLYILLMALSVLLYSSTAESDSHEIEEVVEAE